MTQKDVCNLQISAEGLFFNLQPIEGVSDFSTGLSFSILDYSPALTTNAPDEYVFCTFEENIFPFLGQFQCDLKIEENSKRESLSNNGQKLQMTMECESGKLEVNGNMEKLWGSVSNADTTEVANFVVGSVEQNFVINVKTGERENCLFASKISRVEVPEIFSA